MPNAPTPPTPPTQPTQPTQPAPPTPPPTEPAKTVKGIPNRMVSSLSISSVGNVGHVSSLEKREVEILTQERLQELWDQLLEKSADDEKFHDLLMGKTVELKNNNMFYIFAPSIYFDTLFRNYQDRILDFFRQSTNNDAIQYKIMVKVEAHEAKAYMPREKFDEMAQRNPALFSLRKIFPDIDF